MPTTISTEHVRLEGNDIVTFTGDGARALRNALIRKPSPTLAELSQIGEGPWIINPEDIEIDDFGQVLISNAGLVTAIQARIDTAGGSPVGFFDTNCSCSSK